MLNKYFWTGLTKLVSTRKSESINIRSLRLDAITIANESETFEEFLVFWIKSTLPLNMSSRAIYKLNSEDILLFSYGFHDLIITETQSYNFISCHEVLHRDSVYTSLLSPFDGIVWIILTISFVTINLLLYYVSKTVIWIIVLFASSLEVSIMDYEHKLVSKPGIRFLLGIWIF